MQLPATTRLAFAASGSATGLVVNGVSYFLLLFYSQVLGLEPALAGLALLIALAVDAVSDPLVGRWSDRLRSRWGRRHPFMLAAVAPTALFYFLLWVPPDLSQAGLFSWLLGVSIAMRLSLTAHVVPFNALLPEIAPDYDQRTRLTNDSYAAGWFLGTLMAVAMYAIWLADTPEYPDGSGFLRIEGYGEAGAVTAILVGLGLALPVATTWRFIPTLQPPPERSPSTRDALSEARGTFADRSFAALLASGLFSAAATGASTALWAYVQPYFWGFDSNQLTTLLTAQLVSAVLAFLFLPPLSRKRDKRSVLIGVSLATTVVGASPVMLALLGWFLPIGHPWLFPVMAVLGVLQVMLVVMSSALFASMLADLVEARALETGRREEGLIGAVQSFTTKVAGGVGIWLGGVALSLVDFPSGDAALTVSAAAIESLGWLYGPGLALLYLASIAALLGFQLDRKTQLRVRYALAEGRRLETSP